MTRSQGYFSLCFQYNLKLHPGKYQPFKKSVYWFGYIILRYSIRYIPRLIDLNLLMEFPHYGSELQKFVCANKWMIFAISMLQDLVKHLVDCI